MNNFSFKVFSCFIPTPSRGVFWKVWGFILLFLVLNFFTVNFAYASYQKIAPGDTVTLGEFVFDDNFVATTTPCTVGITNPLNVEIKASTTPMIANDDGWHYYNYTTAGNAPSGVWPSIMKCGSAQRGDLVIVDKSFIVDWSVVSTSTIKDVVDDSYTVTLSDFGGTTVNTAYKAKLQVLNYAAIPTDADSLPTVVITDSAGTVQVPAGVMTKDSSGTYSYSYSIGGSAVGGVWETVVSVVINGKTIRVNDFWSISSSPADVNITEITDKVIPTITASVRIDNKGTSASDFYYVYCIVTSENNLCGGNDDTDSGSGTAYINAGSFINLSLTLDEAPTAGTYWFKVKARALAETNWAASTKQFTAESGTITPPPSSSGGGGGGGGGYVAPITSVVFSGRAYPKSTITLLKDAMVAATIVAGSDAKFEIRLSGLTGGSYIFSLYSEDNKGRRSTLLSFPLSVTAGVTTNVSGIFIAPTINVDKTEVKRGDNLAIFGQSMSQADITIVINSEKDFFGKTVADKDGVYLYNFDTSVIDYGTHYAKSKTGIANLEFSPFSQVITFEVATKTIIKKEVIKKDITKGDLNIDKKVNLVDFSIMAFWYNKPLTETAKKVDLNSDGKVNLTDFSILAYFWTG